jgi:SAM-dependent methyltransferase
VSVSNFSGQIAKIRSNRPLPRHVRRDVYLHRGGIEFTVSHRRRVGCSQTSAMRLDASEIARYLSCPDEGARLESDSEGLRCVRCSRLFRFLKPNLLEILPSRPVTISSSEVPSGYETAYSRSYSRIWEPSDDAIPWGASESSSVTSARRRERQAEEALRLLRDAPGDADGVFCDLSAGAGHTTFAAAPRCRLVFHCDLSVAAVHYASARATRMGFKNMVIVRADYFRPPFLNSVQRLTCLDSLIRGPWHDIRLLANIRQALAPGGSAVVDFHNWWHNPLRRLGLLRQNFGENRSYTRSEVLQLLRQAGIDEFTVRAFVQEADSNSLPTRVLSRLMPATRFVVRMISQGPSMPHV